MLVLVLGFPFVLMLVFAGLATVLTVWNKNTRDFFFRKGLIVYAFCLGLLLLLVVLYSDIQSLLAMGNREFDKHQWLAALLTWILAIPTGLLFFKFEATVIAAQTKQQPSAHSAVVPRWRKVWFVPLLLLIVVIEEIIWRAWLPATMATEWAITPFWWTILSSLAFGLHHVFFGWIHIVFKSGYGLVWLIMTQISGSLLPAVLSHCAFNFAVYLKSSNAPPSASKDASEREG